MKKIKSSNKIVFIYINQAFTDLMLDKNFVRLSNATILWIHKRSPNPCLSAQEAAAMNKSSCSPPAP
jgi:hypothetical protein